MHFTINLATRTYLDHQLVNRIGIAFLVVLVALLAWNVSSASWGAGELRRLKSDIAAYETRLNSRPSGVSEKDYSRMQASIRFHNSVIERKSYNWLGLLDRLEILTPEGVTLAALEPETNNGELRIDGRTATFAQVRSYLERLEDSKIFANVQLVSHQALILGERTHGVQFSLVCRAVKQ